MKNTNLNPQQLDQYYKGQQTKNEIMQWVAVIAIFAAGYTIALLYFCNF